MISFLLLSALLLSAAMPFKGRITHPTGRYVIFEVNEFFIDILGDVPLYEGINVDYDSLLIFDKPDGRYIELVAYIKSGVHAAQIEQFYAQSLPMLGWKNMGNRAFVRQNERLKINFHESDSTRFVRFEVSPEKK
jgi:hypothetical protein